MQDSNGPEHDDESSIHQAPQLTAIELRLLGALMEKQLTTPDQYPLTVNSILTACNQKSSRDPISSYHQGEIVRTLQSLEDKNYVRKEYGSRADKYSQRFMHHLELGKKQQAVLCIMMLRGPQTLSELSTRTQRMNQFNDKDDLNHCIERLCEREVPFAMRLGHQPGQRGERFGHLFSGTPEVSHSVPSTTISAETSAANRAVDNSANDIDQETLTLLESELTDLGKMVERLNSENIALREQLERLYELTGHSLPEPSQTG